MSENIPESIPTSADHRSHRPTKKRALTPNSQQSAQVEALFANPDRDIRIPSNDSQNKSNAAPPEIVANVQGSSAGAGSGEFHVYKASRRREYERLRLLDEEVEKEKQDREFEERQMEARKKDEEKLGRNQAKRAKAKARKEKAKRGDRGEDGGDEGKQNGDQSGVKRKLGAAKIAMPAGEDQENGGAGGGTVEEQGRSVEEEGIKIHDDD